MIWKTMKRPRKIDTLGNLLLYIVLANYSCSFTYGLFQPENGIPNNFTNGIRLEPRFFSPFF
jgi:hypothetical protein